MNKPAGTRREEKLNEAYRKEQKALSEGKSRLEAMIDSGLILDSPLNEQSFLEKDEEAQNEAQKHENGNKRLLRD